MPAAEPLPTIQDFVNAYQGGLVSRRKHGDTHEGAIHDHWAGVGAILWRRMVERDQAEFRALYFDNAEDDRLDAYIVSRFPDKELIKATVGTGTVRLSRASAAAGAGDFLTGTRIAVGGPGAPLRYYLVTGESACGATELVKIITVHASETGSSSKVNVRAGERSILRIEDPIWDNSWVVEELTCAEGTVRETSDAARARVRSELVEERLGYESLLIKSMKEAGASTVALFRSDYLGDALDFGLNRIYVGDANFETSAALLRDCRLAVPSVAIAGASNQVLAMTTGIVDLDVVIRFWDSPEKFAMASAVENAKAAAVEYFETGENPFTWDLMGLRGAIRRAVEDTQEIEITPSVSPPVLATLFSAYPLPRFRTTPERVAVTLASPM